MSSLVTPALGVVAALASAIGGPLLTGILQNRRLDRLRSALVANIKLREDLITSGIGIDHGLLDRLIEDQLTALAAKERFWLAHKRNWYSLVAVAFVLTPGAVLLWYLWGFDAWWSWAIFWIVAPLLVILAGIGIYQTFRPDETAVQLAAVRDGVAGTPPETDDTPTESEATTV